MLFGLALAWSALVLLGCGPSPVTPIDTGGSGGSAPDAGGADGGGDTSASPLAHSIEGFELAVKQGSWWEYSQVYDSSYAFDTGSGSTHSESTFVLMLGTPTTIAGDQAFPVQMMVLESACTANPGNCVAAGPVGAWQPWMTWRYLSFVGKRIRGSADGQTYSVLFDANTAIWPATSNGMFGVFPSKTGLREATQIQGTSGSTVWLVRESSSSTGCDEIPGYGVVCNSSGNGSTNGNEKWDPALGCIESGSGGNGYGTSGSANNSSSTTLVDSSITGDRSPPKASSGGGGTGSAPGGDGGTVGSDAGNAGACVDFTGVVAAVAAIAKDGMAPVPSGGDLPDGLYVATAVNVYGAGSPAGTRVGSYSGTFKLMAPSFERQYAGSSVKGSYGAGTLSTSGATATATFACSSDGTTTASFQYTVTSATTVDVAVPGPGYTSVVTYTKM